MQVAASASTASALAIWSRNFLDHVLHLAVLVQGEVLGGSAFTGCTSGVAAVIVADRLVAEKVGIQIRRAPAPALRIGRGD